MATRICVLGLPRSGSQYIAEILCNRDSSITNGFEPFTEFHPFKLVSNNDNKLESVKTDTIPVEQRIHSALSAIQLSDHTQNIVIRVFPYDYVKPFFKEILDVLSSCGFTFVTIHRRDLEKHLLSFGTALATNVWSVHDKNYQQPLINITHFDNLKWLYENSLCLNTLVESYGVTSEIIYYEDWVVANSHRELGLYKQSPEDPYSKILNSTEVKQYIEKLFNENRIHKT